MGSIVLSFFLLINAVAANAQTNSLPQPTPPYSEAQIAHSLELLTYREMKYPPYGKVVDRGLAQLTQILKKMDLSTRLPVKTALMSVIKSDPAQFPLISYEARRLAAQLLGQAKLVNLAADEMIGILHSADPDLAKMALIEFAKTTKANPAANLLEHLRGLKFYDTLSSMALQTADRETILFLVQSAIADKDFDRLFGLDLKEAADEVIKAYKTRIDPPVAPSNLSITLTTYRSIQLSWKDNATNEEGFTILRAVGNEAFKELASVPANQIYYADAPLNPAVTYHYKVKVFNSNREKPESTEVAIETPNIPNPLPDPLPPIPALPKSPNPGLGFLDLTTRLKLKIEGVLHVDTAEALLRILAGGSNLPSSVAIEIGKLLETQFDRKLFDYSGNTSALGLWAIDALKTRATYEASNAANAPSIQQANRTKLNANAAALEKIFLADLEYSGPALPIH